MERPKLKTQADAIKYFFETMDVEMIEAFLDDDLKYNTEDKKEFIYNVKKVFDRFAECGDTNLIAVKGKCGDCFKGKEGFTFYGNKSRNYISILFIKEGKKIETLYECSAFRNSKYKLNLQTQFYMSGDD